MPALFELLRNQPLSRNGDSPTPGTVVGVLLHLAAFDLVGRAADVVGC